MVLNRFSSIYETDFTVQNITAMEFLYPVAEWTDRSKNARQNHLLHFLTDPKAERRYFLSDGSTFVAHAGDIVFAPEGSRYRCCPESGEKQVKGLCVCFTLTAPDGDRLSFSCLPCVVGQIHTSDMSHCLSAITETCLLHPEDKFAMRTHFFALLQSMREEEPMLMADSPLAPAFRYIYSHAEENIEVSFLASLCYQSESQFRRLFMRDTGGVTPKDFLMNLRLHRAEQYAAMGLSLSEIAERLGFYDSSALSHAYKKKTGNCLLSRLR